MIIGERLSDLRKDKKLRQRDLAKILGVSESTISLYEREMVSPPDDIKIKLIKYFNITMDYLMGLSDIANHNYKNYLILPEHINNEIMLMINEYVDYLLNKNK